MSNTSLALVRDDAAPVHNSNHAFEPSNFTQAMEAARLLHKCGFFPDSCRNPEAAFVILCKGRELGLPMMQAATEICIVKGKVQLSAALMVALVLRSGAAEYFKCTETTPTRAVYETKRRGYDPQSLAWTIEDAQRAGLIRRGEKGPSAWEAHPAAMLRARASSALARMVYPDILVGVYTPDEIRDFDRRDELPPAVRTDQPGPFLTKALAEEAAAQAAELQEPSCDPGPADAACTSCGAPMVWLHTEAGKAVPVDPAPGVESGQRFDPKIHRAHFATCPHADQHRRRGPQSTQDEAEQIRPWLERIQQAATLEQLAEVRQALNQTRRTKAQGEALRRALADRQAALELVDGELRAPTPERLVDLAAAVTTADQAESVIRGLSTLGEDDRCEVILALAERLVQLCGQAEASEDLGLLVATAARLGAVQAQQVRDAAEARATALSLQFLQRTRDQKIAADQARHDGRRAGAGDVDRG